MEDEDCDKICTVFILPKGNNFRDGVNLHSISKLFKTVINCLGSICVCYHSGIN